MPIINTNALSLSGSNLTSTINGISSTPLDISPAVKANAWALVGNSGTVAGTNFVGTTDAVDFVTKTNNTERLRVLSTGNVGIGTTAPGSALDVKGTIRLSGSTSGFVGLAAAAAAGATTYTLPAADGTAGFQLATNGAGVLSWTDARGTTTNTLSSSVNTITSTVNGVAATAPAVNSVSNTSSANTLLTTVNGIAGATVPIINTNALSLTGSNLTSTINGLASNALDISPAVKANAWALVGNASTTASSSVIGTTANNNFIGTTDAIDWVAATSGYERLRIAKLGNIGIQNTAPSALLDIQSSAAANAFNVTTGNVVNITGNALTTGAALNVNSTGTITTGGNIASLTGNSATTGNILNLSGTALTTGSVLNATAGTTTGNAVNVTANGVTTGNGINLSSNGLTSGSGINVSSTGTITTGGQLLNLTGNSATTGNIITLSGTGLTTGSVINATAGTTTGDAVKLTSNSVTNGNGINISANGLTTGNGLNIASTSTAGTGSGSSNVLKLARSGANSNASHTAYGINSAVTNTGTTSTNIAGYFSASGATNNYGIIVPSGGGNVGIGTSAPTNALHVVASSDPLLLSGVQTGTTSDNLLTINGSNLVKSIATSNFVLAGTAWLTTGNTGTTASTSAIGVDANNNFIGTTDYKDFVLVSNKRERMRIKQASGYIGIGTLTPRAVLDVTKDSSGKGIVVLQNTNIAGYTSVDMFDNASNLSATFGYGNSSVGAPFTSRGYFNSYANDFVMVTGNTQTTGGSIFISGTTTGASVGIGTLAPATNAALSIKDGHLQIQQTTAPTKTAGGTTIIGTTGTATLSNATDIAGNITIVASGTAPSAAGTMITVKYNVAYATAPIVQVTATNANGATFPVYVTSSTTNFTLTNLTKLNNGTYTWSYHVIETQ